MNKDNIIWIIISAVLLAGLSFFIGYQCNQKETKYITLTNTVERDCTIVFNNDKEHSFEKTKETINNFHSMPDSLKPNYVYKRSRELLELYRHDWGGGGSRTFLQDSMANRTTRESVFTPTERYIKKRETSDTN